MFLDTFNQGKQKENYQDNKCSWTHVIRKQKENYQGL